jgi:hypothetical protein
LATIELVFEQNPHVAHFPRDLVSKNSDDCGDILGSFSGGKGATDGKSVYEVMDQGGHKIEVAC